MSLTTAEQALVTEAMNLVQDALKQLASGSTNPKVLLIVKILEGAITVAEMMAGV